MKVAYINSDPGIPLFGNKGCSVHVREVIRSFLRKQYNVDAYTYTVGEKQALPGLKIVESGKSVARDNENVFCKRINSTLKNLLADQEYDLVYERYSLWSYQALVYAHDHEVPSILEVNAPLIEEQAQHRHLANLSLAEEVLQKAINLASLVVCVSDEVKKYICAKLSPTDQCKVVSISNGVDVKKYSESKVEKSPIPTIGFVGSLKPWHGVDVLITAFSKLLASHPNTKLAIIGEGPMKDDLVGKVVDLGLQKQVDLLGWISSEELPRYLNRWHIAVAPYPALENFYFSPLKLFDYMAAGLPIIASNIGQISRILTDKHNALLVNAGEVDALASAMQYLLDNQESCEYIGARARAMVQKNYSWDVVTDKIVFNLEQTYERSKVN